MSESIRSATAGESECGFSVRMLNVKLERQRWNVLEGAAPRHPGGTRATKHPKKVNSTKENT
jgi:hypothetical protein